MKRVVPPPGSSNATNPPDPTRQPLSFPWPEPLDWTPVPIEIPRCVLEVYEQYAELLGRNAQSLIEDGLEMWSNVIDEEVGKAERTRRRIVKVRSRQAEDEERTDDDDDSA